MSKQPQTVPCPDCKGTGGKTQRSTRQATDHNGRTVTVHDSAWTSCDTCVGVGQVAGGQG
ncbi:hypothetical protein [Streptomyces tauricus]